MWVYAAEEFECYLDGKALAYGRPMVSLGRHVLALRIKVEQTEHGILMFAGTYDEVAPRRLSRKTGRKVTIRSAAAEGWKYSLAEQVEEAWKSLEFDDSGWRDMVEKAVPRPAKHNFQYYRLTSTKVPGLGVNVDGPLRRLFRNPRTGDAVFVRRTFSI